MEINKGRANRWAQADKAWLAYRHYISKKPQPFALTFTDLAHVSNFKGGNSIVHPDEIQLASSLPILSKRMQDLSAYMNEFKELRSVPVAILPELIDRAVAFCTPKNAPLDGFGESYRSALLHFHFPDLLPIIDKWVLLGSEIIRAFDSTQFDRAEQVRNILQYYPELVRRFWFHLKADKSLTVRKIDWIWFTRPEIITVPRPIRRRKGGSRD